MDSAPPVPQAVLGLLERALSAACAASVRAAVKLGIPDALGDVAATADELAKAVGADPKALRRLLHALTCYGVLSEEAEGHYSHTETSRLLRSDSPHSLRNLALWLTEPWTWELWDHLDEAVRTGKDVFAQMHGREFFEHLHIEWPESAAVFDLAMTEQSKVSAISVADTLSISSDRTVADIGGGQGHVLATLLERNPALHGVLLDLPDVVANADPRLQAGGALADRVHLLAGDCRQEIPVEADTYLFKNILGWEEQTVVILRNAVQAARPGARVVIVENFVDAGPGQTFTTAMDLRMLLSAGGKKHTQAGLLRLVKMSGLIVKDVRPVNSYLHMIEAEVPA